MSENLKDKPIIVLPQLFQHDIIMMDEEQNDQSNKKIKLNPDCDRSVDVRVGFNCEEASHNHQPTALHPSILNAEPYDSTTSLTSESKDFRINE